MLSQVAQFAPMFDVEVEDASVDFRATFDSAAKYGLTDAPTAFEAVAIRLDVHSQSQPAKVKALLEHAEMGCHAVQSLENPVPVVLQATLNRVAVELGGKSGTSQQ